MLLIALTLAGFIAGTAAGIGLAMFAVWIGMNRISRDSLESFGRYGLRSPEKGEIIGHSEEEAVEAVAGRFWQEEDPQSGALIRGMFGRDSVLTERSEMVPVPVERAEIVAFEEGEDDESV